MRRLLTACGLAFVLTTPVYLLFSALPDAWWDWRFLGLGAITATVFYPVLDWLEES